ncbi:cardioactive peptide [Macrosteles quadrilineatus]|uniref:cardioactive peptide n=1 Tax=Macrosteles quadrilineatus TaxID=74068 RepID=UPI0023E1E4EF|nr:cardioactive peptide [Macrosteles quadrilineatus]
MYPQVVVLSCVVAAVVLISNSQPALADDVIIQKRVYDGDLAAIFDPKKKKPFCNAFTGCGRKRADESMATLVDLNSEPAVEELSRQILSEAKLWEAIQEARVELLRRHNQQAERERYAVKPFPLSSLKKRSIDYTQS